MRKLVAALSVTSLALAGSTVYLARELAAERARAIPPASSPVSTTASTQLPASSAPLAPATVPPVNAPQAPGAPDSIPLEDVKRAQSEYSRQFLARLADPEGREELLAERKLMMRNSYPRLDRVLGLTPEEHSRLLELFALQQLDMQELQSRCVMQPDCMEVSLSNYQDPREREIAELLGDRQARFENYRNSISERESVSQLSSRLTDAQRLSDESAENLISALAEERNRIHQEAADRGVGVRGFGMGAGMLFTPEDGGSFEARYEAARQSSQRLRDRAAAYLTPEQRRVFDEMQEETLMALRAQLRHKETSSRTMTVVN